MPGTGYQHEPDVRGDRVQFPMILNGRMNLMGRHEKRRRRSAGLFIALMVGLALMGSQAPSEGASPFRVIMAPAQSRILVGEPLYIHVYVVSESDRNEELAVQPLWGRSIQISIRREDGQTLEYGGLGTDAAAPDVAIPLAPGMIRRIPIADGPVTWQSDSATAGEGLVFDQPGRAFLTIRAVFRWGQQPIAFQSQEETVMVTLPTTAADQAVLETIRNNKDLALALQTAQCSTDTLKTVNTLVETYPDSTYTPYLKMALIGTLTTRPYSDVNTQDQELKKALAWIDSLDAKAAKTTGNPFPALETALYRRILGMDRLGQAEAASRALQDLARRFPHSGYLLPSDTLARKYAGADQTPDERVWTLTGR